MSGSRGNFNRFSLSAVSAFYLRASLATSACLLSSVVAVEKARLLPTIIAGIGRLSSLTAILNAGICSKPEG